MHIDSTGEPYPFRSTRRIGWWSDRDSDDGRLVGDPYHLAAGVPVRIVERGIVNTHPCETRPCRLDHQRGPFVRVLVATPAPSGAGCWYAWVDPDALDDSAYCGRCGVGAGDLEPGGRIVADRASGRRYCDGCADTLSRIAWDEPARITS